MVVSTSSFMDDEIVQRLLRAEYDHLVFEALQVGLLKHNVRALDRTYTNTRSRDSRSDMLLEQADRLRRSRLEAYSGRKVDDILVETITRTIAPFPRIRDNIFGHSDSERDLYPVIERYLRKLRREGDLSEVHATYSRKDLPVGNPDFICLRTRRPRRLRSDEVTAIDAKATLASLHGFYSQASKYQKGCDRVFLATTRWVAIQEGEEHLKELLNGLGVGLIAVDMTTGRCDTRTSSSSDGARDKDTKQRLLRALA
jgi:hypothetical protein